MHKKLLLLSLAISALTLNLTGCSALKDEMTEAMSQNQEIKLSVNAEANTINNKKFNWVELDKLTTFKEIRNTWDDKLNIVKFDSGSKNGAIFIDTEGNWQGNNTLYNIFQNKLFITDYWKDSKFKSAIAQPAMDEFSDIDNESTGIVASINAYFNILPTNDDGTSGLMDYLTRAEAMAAIFRGDTPVIYAEENQEFMDAFGHNENNIYAVGVAENSYLDYKNGGLNYDTYNSPITRIEAIYILINRYFPSELENYTINGSFSDCKNAGNVANKLGFTDKHAWQSYELEYCLQNYKDGAPETLYKAMSLAQSLGIVSSDSRWNEALMGGELVNMMIACYEAVSNRDGFLVNAKAGENVGQSLYIVEEEEAPVEVSKTETTISSTAISQVRDVTNLDDLFRIYGDEINMTDEEIAEAYDVASQFTFEPCDTWMQVDFCSYLNVRTGPSTDFRILRSVPTGTKVHIVARCKENGWYRIIAEGKIVYQCGVYFSDFEGSEDYKTRTGEKANDTTNITSNKTE